MFYLSIPAAIVYAHSSVDTKVTIVPVKTSHGSRWLAKSGDRVLWSYPEYYHDIRIDLLKSGLSLFSVTEKANRLPAYILVDKQGAIHGNLSMGLHDPRRLLFDGRYLVYDTGNFPRAYYSSISGGEAQWAWYNGARTVHVFDVKTFREVWTRPELKVGMPLICRHGVLDSFCILNSEDCMRYDWPNANHYPVVPQIGIVERNAGNPKATREGRLSLSRRDANRLFDEWFDSGPTVRLSKVDSLRFEWSSGHVRIIGVGNRASMAKKLAYMITN